MTRKALAWIFSLALGVTACGPVLSVAQSDGLDTQAKDMVRAKEILNKLQEGQRPTQDELDILERVLLDNDQRGAREAETHRKVEPAVNSASSAVNRAQPKPELSSTAQDTKDSTAPGEHVPQASSRPLTHDTNGGSQILADTPVANYYHGDMMIKDLYYGSHTIGSTIWLRRGSDRLRAKYFASGDVYRKLSAFNERIVLVCSGAFISGYDGDGSPTPEGLTVDNGEIVNRDLSSKMDGLVVVYATGSIAVADIADGSLNIEDDRGKQTLDVRSSRDKTALLDWAVRNNLTIFQTQLLASTRGLRLDVSKAHKDFRERRFLAIVRDNNTHEVIHVIVNIPTAYYLGDLTQMIYNYLHTHATVDALLNLETGGGDVLTVNNPNGQPLSYPTGTKSVNIARSLLVYYDSQ